MTLLEKTKTYAIRKHKDVNQKYDTYDYDFHLNMVYETAQQFISNVASEDRESVLAACWVHDIIEDARETYNDVKKATNETIAELAYALSNEKGRSRAERANDKYYEGIRHTKNASFIKFCDRIANVSHAKKTGSRMLAIYKKENKAFVAKILVPGCEEIAAYLQKILEE